MSRKYNFSAGPSTLPLPVLEQIRDEMVDFKGAGFSLIEASHRGKEYEQVHNDAISLLKKIFGVPDNFKILFLGGGAHLQFGMVPMNILTSGSAADYTLTGAWSKKAYEDAKKIGRVNVAFDGAQDGFNRLPSPKDVKVNPEACYLHLTSNETIQGTQWQEWPDAGKVPLVVDMSSDMFNRPVPWGKIGLIYAGAQKNLGPAGATVVIIRDDLVERSPATLPVYLNYKNHVKENSLYNTPPVFSIYAIKLVLEWTEKNGGLKGIQQLNERKANMLYETIDKSGGYYNCPVAKTCRSKMNVVFKLPNEDLDKKFLEECKAKGMVQLKGHRSVGGCRASIYNAMPVEGVATLAQFMKEFAAKNG